MGSNPRTMLHTYFYVLYEFVDKTKTKWGVMYAQLAIRVLSAYEIRRYSCLV
jgi:hypothetical protein